MKALTLGIVSGNRNKCLHDLLVSIPASLLDLCEIIVVEDSGTPLTDGLADIINNFRCEVHENKQSFAESFCQLFELCKTKYLMICYDDDLLIIDGIKTISEYLVTCNHSLICPQFIDQDGSTFRGQDKIKPIPVDDIENATSHLPGIVFNVKDCLPHIQVIRDRLKRNCGLSFYYPQHILFYLLHFRGKSMTYHPAKVCQRGADLPSTILSSTGKGYNSVEGRWQIYLGYLEFFDDIPSWEVPDLKRIIRKRMRTAYGRLSVAIKNYDKAVYENWIGSSFITNLTRPLFFAKCIWKGILNRL